MQKTISKTEHLLILAALSFAVIQVCFDENSMEFSKSRLNIVEMKCSNRLTQTKQYTAQTIYINYKPKYYAFVSFQNGLLARYMTLYKCFTYYMSLYENCSHVLLIGNIIFATNQTMD